MTIEEFSVSLSARLDSIAKEVGHGLATLENLGSAVTQSWQILSEVLEFAHHYHFVNLEEEIKYFKDIKPRFLSQYIYLKKVFEIRICEHFQKSTSGTVNYSNELGALQAFALRNAKLYAYYLSKSSHLDSAYFTCTKNSADSIACDDGLEHSFDIRLSKIIASDLINKFIRDMTLHRHEIAHLSASKLMWTGSKTDLTELIYALHNFGVFNGGQSDIKEIAEIFATTFRVNLGDYYRTFHSIQSRKREELSFLARLNAKFKQKLGTVS